MTLAERLLEFGLFVRGVTRLDPGEIETCGFADDKPVLALVGNIGSSYWPLFSQSAEYLDGEADPLDRWSRRVAKTIATASSLHPIYPFEGPPYYPFQQWARRAEALEQSPIGIMMHPEYGLWHSYRFALLGKQFDNPKPTLGPLPCTSCETRPCLQRCPVDAFDGNGYDVERCADYLRKTPQAECHTGGCLARYACPIAPEFSYLPAQGQFHLQAFLNPRK